MKEGDGTGGCGSSGGQVYARHMNFRRAEKYDCPGFTSGQGVRGIMYDYYFPKDRTHRHDWENVVVWTDWEMKTTMGASLSRHGCYLSSNKSYMHGLHKQVLYGEHLTTKAMKDPSLSRDKAENGYNYKHPLANWYQLGEDSKSFRETLNCAWNGGVRPRINDRNFAEAMNMAFDSACKEFGN